MVHHLGERWPAFENENWKPGSVPFVERDPLTGNGYTRNRPEYSGNRVCGNVVIANIVHRHISASRDGLKMRGHY